VKLIVGLGNPGAKYAGTRHNVGFEVVDRVASRGGIGLTTEKFHGWFGRGDVCGEPVVLLKPTTFMNRSGRAVLAAGRFYQIELEDLLVVVDDMALPVGRIRIRRMGSSGGHKGVQDIIDRLGTDAWCRLRLGVGERIGDPLSYPLSRFDDGEQPIVQQSYERAADAVACWIEHGAEAAMNRFNSGPTQEPGDGEP